MQRSISKALTRASRIIMVCTLLASGAYATAESGDHDQQCSNRTLSGDYGFQIEGTIFSIPGVVLPPGTNLPLRGLALQHYDGKGNLTQVDHIVFNGMPPAQEWTPGSGSYSVNPDCTGRAVINVPGNPLSPVNLHFVVVKDGKEIHQVVDANAVTAVGRRVD